MFTIRFIKHGGRGHVSYSCTSYETTHNERNIEVKMALKDGTEYYEQIGATEPFDIAYVTNEAGRTIDKITQ
jgi:hypothetical protein